MSKQEAQPKLTVVALPSGVMTQRWLLSLRKSLPLVDLEDVLSMRDPLLKLNRQIAPEHSQTIYIEKLSSEKVIGDYISTPANATTIQVSQEVRLYVVTIIMEVHRLKNYRDETLYLACSLLDRFLAALIRTGKQSPCLIRLAFVSILIAAKLE